MGGVQELLKIVNIKLFLHFPRNRIYQAPINLFQLQCNYARHGDITRSYSSLVIVSPVFVSA